MNNSEVKEIIVKPTLSDKKLEEFLSQLTGVSSIYVNPEKLQDKKNFKIIYDSNDADIIVCKSFKDIVEAKSAGKEAGYYKKLLDNQDIEEMVTASANGADFVIADAEDWKIIPLENLIAKLHKSKTKIYTTAKNPEEVRTMFNVLELGVDGVILSANSLDDVKNSMQFLSQSAYPIKPAIITEIKDVGTGERVCVDTASMLEIGEGMLVGSKSNFLFLVHNESVGSSFTSPRPFRVNAGALYCYTIGPDGKTRYLSEIESGHEILIVDKAGNARSVTVGRSKIETRPLRLLRAEIEGHSGTVILQNAETIRLVTRQGKLISVTDLKKGDEVLGYAKKSSGRHFGMEVDEYILEK